jgi:Flp pilus assembly protein protease CpaA
MIPINTNLVLLTVLIVTAIAGYIDLRTGKIPNQVVLVGFIAGALMHLFVHQRQAHPESLADWGDPLLSIAVGVLACALVPVVLFYTGAMGGGDAKLLAVVGATLGPLVGLQVEFYAFIAIALYAPIQMAYQGRILRLLVNIAALASNPFRPKGKRRPIPQELMTKLRFGPAVFAAAAVVSFLRWRVS